MGIASVVESVCRSRQESCLRVLDLVHRLDQQLLNPGLCGEEGWKRWLEHHTNTFILDPQLGDIFPRHIVDALVVEVGSSSLKMCLIRVLILEKYPMRHTFDLIHCVV